MASDSNTRQNLKQLRVDNWAVFFLQRLQLLFAKGDCCDLTLKFVSGQELKVHRLVLSTSTSYFENMECDGNVINLPESLPYSVVHPIINFLYSGRLEFKAELHSQVLAIAKVMKLAILARILVTQKDTGNTVTKSSSPEFKLKYNPIPTTSLPKNKLQLNQTQNTNFMNVLAGKKLPIWKKRSVPYRIESKPIKEEEPRPTRFEWPDEQTCTNLLMTAPSFSSLSYESDPVILSPAASSSITSSSLSSSSSSSSSSASASPPSLPSTSLKKRVMPPPNSSIPDKIFKPNNNIVSNDMAMTTKNNNDSQLNTSEYNYSDDDDDDGHFETIHTYGDSDDDMDVSATEVSASQQLKPILKPMTDTPVQTPNKKVRFSFAPEDKENKDEKALLSNKNDKISPATNTDKTVEKPDITNHAKIIQEVLRKYPNLVKNKKNIKLKITAPGDISKHKTITIDAKKRIVQNKSQYIVLKPAAKTDTVNTSNTTTLPSSSEMSSEIQNGSVDKTNKAETDWKCESCEIDSTPLKFESYYELRKHLQDTHLEKMDSRVCEYCGYKASKRNLHLYHLYTKHGVDPPKNVKFPKCSQCAYIALSESLLVKHLNSHQMAKDLTCAVCNTTFRTYSSLHVHSLSCKPNSEARLYACPTCKKMFKTNVSLNAHLKVCSVSKEENDEEDDGGSGEEVDGGGESASTSASQQHSEVIEVPILETVDLDKAGDHTLVQIPSGIILTDTPSMTLLPSSESDALNNVATSIATSIGLTVALPQEHHQQAVILLNSGSQFFLQENNSVVVSSESEVDEYIVPELLHDEMGQIYTTESGMPYTVSGSGVITCPVMSIQEANDENKTIQEHCVVAVATTTTPSTTTTLTFENEVKRINEDINCRTSATTPRLLTSDDTHLESSNTRIQIKDAHAEELDVTQMASAMKPIDEVTVLEDHHENTIQCVIESENCCETETINRIEVLTEDMVRSHQILEHQVEENNSHNNDNQMEIDDGANIEQFHENEVRHQGISKAAIEQKEVTVENFREINTKKSESNVEGVDEKSQNDNNTVEIQEGSFVEHQDDNNMNVQEDDNCMTVQEDDNCMTVQVDDNCMTVQEDDNCMTVQEDDNCMTVQDDNNLKSQEINNSMGLQEIEVQQQVDNSVGSEESSNNIVEETQVDNSIEIQKNDSNLERNQDANSIVQPGTSKHQGETNVEPNVEEDKEEIIEEEEEEELTMKIVDEEDELNIDEKDELNIDEKELGNRGGQEPQEETQTLDDTMLINKEKAISLVRDWGFDNEEDTVDSVEDPESRPTRPTVDL